MTRVTMMENSRPEEFYKDVVYRELEASETHNIFTNYNNFSRDFFVFEETFKECWKVIRHLEKDRQVAYNMRDWNAKMGKVPAIVAIQKQEDRKIFKYCLKLCRKYEKLLKQNSIDFRHLGDEASDEIEAENKAKESKS